MASPRNLVPFAALILLGCGGGGGGRAPGSSFRVTALDTVERGRGYGTDENGASVKFGFEPGMLVETIDGETTRRQKLAGADTSDATPWGVQGEFVVATVSTGTIVVRESDGSVVRLSDRMPLFLSGTRLMSQSTVDPRLYYFNDLDSGTELSTTPKGDFTPLGLAGGRLLYRRNGAVRLRDNGDGSDTVVATPSDALTVSPELILGADGEVLGSATFNDGTRLFRVSAGTVILSPLLPGIAGNVVPTALSEDGSAASFTSGSIGYYLAWDGLPQKLSYRGQNATTGLSLTNARLSRGVAQVGDVRVSFRIDR